MGRTRRTRNVSFGRQRRVVEDAAAVDLHERRGSSARKALSALESSKPFSSATTIGRLLLLGGGGLLQAARACGWRCARCCSISSMRARSQPSGGERGAAAAGGGCLGRGRRRAPAAARGCDRPRATPGQRRQQRHSCHRLCRLIGDAGAGAAHWPPPSGGWRWAVSDASRDRRRLPRGLASAPRRVPCCPGSARALSAHLSSPPARRTCLRRTPRSGRPAGAGDRRRGPSMMRMTSRDPSSAGARSLGRASNTKVGLGFLAG